MRQIQNKIYMKFIILLASVFIISCATTSKSLHQEKKENKVEQKKSDKEPNKQKNLEKQKKKDSNSSQKEKEEEKIPRYDGLKYIGPAKQDFVKGLMFYFKDDCIQAIKSWKEAFQKDDKCAESAFNIALCYERTKKLSQSRKWYIKSYLANTEFLKPLYNLVLLDLKTKNATVDKYIKLVENTKDSVIRNNFIAWLYLQNKQLKKAEEFAKKVLKDDEQNVNAVVTLGSIYYEKKMYKLSEMALSTAEKWNADNFRLQRIFGFLEYKMGNKKNASEHFQKAKKLNPELPEVRNILAILAMEIEDFDTAKKELDFALKIFPDFKEAKLNLAIAYKGLEQFKKSRDILVELEKDKELYPKLRSEVLYNLAILYLDADVDGNKDPKRYDLAIDYVKKYKKSLTKKELTKKMKEKLKEYIKEANVGKRKLAMYWKIKKRREERKRKAEEEQKLFLKMKQEAYNKASEKNTYESWKNYLKEYPILNKDDVLSNKAKLMMDKLKPKEEPKKELKQNSKETPQELKKGEKSDKNVLKKQKDNSKVKTIQNTKIQPKNKEFLIAKQQAYNAVLTVNTVEAWKQYLKDFPILGKDDKLSNDALKRLNRLLLKQKKKGKKK